MPISKPTAPSTTDLYRRSAVEKEAAKVIKIASAAFFFAHTLESAKAAAEALAGKLRHFTALDFGL